VTVRAPANASPGGWRRISQTQWVVISMIAGVAIGYAFPDGPNTSGFHATDLQVL